MGIPRFYNVFIKRLKHSPVQDRLPAGISTLAIDMNGLLHAGAQQIYGYGEGASPDRIAYVARTPMDTLEKEYYRWLSQMLMKLLQQVQPKEALILAVDGVCPLAKIKQQRQRRYKAAMDRPQAQKFDSNSITTGTDFMKRLDAYFKYLVGELKKQLPINIIYTGHMDRGEGEHKIMDIYRNTRSFHDTRKSHAIYGLDADLIVLSTLLPITNVYLIREDINDVVNIEILKHSLYSLMNKRPSFLYDFALIMCFIGNDFLPPVITCLDISTSLYNVIDIYNKMKAPLVDEKGSMIWKNVCQLLSLLANKEPDMVLHLARRSQHYPIQAITSNYDASKDSVDMDSFYMTYYKKATRSQRNIDPSQYNEMMFQYMIGLNWVLTYYIKGTKQVNQGWYYPFDYSPLFEQVSKMCMLMSPKDVSDVYAYIGDIQFDIPHQLLSVMPQKSKELLPVNIQPLMGKGSPIADLFPATFDVDKEIIKHGVALVPFVDPTRILAAVARFSST